VIEWPRHRQHERGEENKNGHGWKGEEGLSVTNGLLDCDSGFCPTKRNLFDLLFFEHFSFPFFVSALRNEQRQPDESNGQVELRKMPVYRKGGGEKLGKSVDLT
jgi:hypothetical protein